MQPKVGAGSRKIREIPANADVAQLVEHFTRNEGVPGSIPGVGFPKALVIRVFYASSAGSTASGGHKTLLAFAGLPDLIGGGPMIAVGQFVEEMRVGRECHRGRVPCLARDLDHRRALGDQQADEAVP